MRTSTTGDDDAATREVRDLVRAAARHHLDQQDKQAARVVRHVVGVSGDAAGRRRVGRVVADALHERLEYAWRHGWQPVDLDHFAARALKQPERTLLVDAMAADLARFTASTVAPDWWDQMSDLDARVWWPADRTWLEARAAAEDWPVLPQRRTTPGPKIEFRAPQHLLWTQRLLLPPRQGIR